MSSIEESDEIWKTYGIGDGSCARISYTVEHQGNVCERIINAFWSSGAVPRDL